MAQKLMAFSIYKPMQLIVLRSKHWTLGEDRVQTGQVATAIEHFTITFYTTINLESTSITSCMFMDSRLSLVETHVDTAMAMPALDFIGPGLFGWMIQGNTDILL